MCRIALVLDALLAMCLSLHWAKCSVCAIDDPLSPTSKAGAGPMQHLLLPTLRFEGSGHKASKPVFAKFWENRFKDFHH